MKMIGETFPLTSMQEGMLFHSLANPGLGVYIQQIVCTLHEPFDEDRFAAAWSCLADRHAVLRTSFDWQAHEQPVQTISQRVEVAIRVEDLQGAEPDRQEGTLREFLRRDRKRGIDLAFAPLMRLTVFKLGESRFAFVWTYHHAILDGRSDRTVLTDFLCLYGRSEPHGELSALPAHSFGDYAEWMSTRSYEQDRAFWTEQLRGLDSTTPVPFAEHKDAAPGPDEPGVRTSCMETTELSALRALAENESITLNTLIQTAWGLLLSHYSGRDDIVFGTTRACRYSGIEGQKDMVGLFINTIPFCVHVHSGQSLSELLAAVRKQHLALRPYENTPLWVIQETAPQLSGDPLFHSILVFEKGSLAHKLRRVATGWEGISVERYRKTGFPISLMVYDDDDELTIRIEYERNLLSEPDAERILAHMQMLLRHMPRSPHEVAVRLRYLPESERRTLLHDWNNTERDYPRDRTLVDLFEMQAARTPDLVAVTCEGSSLSYDELNRRANQLANYLIAMGVGPEVPVGVFLERSLEMVIAIYGIVKAGGAYVPLDPEYPADRIRFMVEDAGLPIVVVQDRLIDRMPAGAAKLLRMNAEWEQIGRECSQNLLRRADPANMAYIIYTSGSTGQPKGVINEHGGIVNRLLWMQEAFELDETDRVLQKTPYSFDVSVWEFFWPLQVGSRLVMAAPGGHKDNSYLVRLIRDAGITTIHFVPSMLELFLEEPNLEECRSLRRVICSGEALRSEHQRRFYQRLSCDLHNLYGPTEAAVDVTHWPCRQEDPRATVPIGFPIANTSIYILDQVGQPVPVGCSGEIHIGGVQVARGYLNRPRLTAERFIPDSFGPDPGARLYKTGDLGRFLPDGAVEYLGRVDFQVKIRGLRVELGEIENVLQQYDGIGQTVVTLGERGPGDRILVAYYAGSGNGCLDTGEVKSFLRARIPDYMVPQHFVELDRLPLSPNGKISRRDLPAPTFERNSAAVFAAPRNHHEQAVAKIWSELLGIEKVGIDDSFFDLGGHSLLLLRLLAKLRSHFGRELRVPDLFAYPTIRSMVEYAAGQSGGEDRASQADENIRRRKAFLRRQSRMATAREDCHG